MNYPLISEYIEAIKSAEDNFSTLTDLQPVLNDKGNPIMTSGNFAVVFKMKDVQTGKLHAVKCFLREQEGRAEAYRMIAEELEYVNSTFLTPIRYLDKELFVDTNTSDETEFPVLLMDWIDGQTLDKYIREHIDDQYELSMLAFQFSRLAMWLMPQPFAHGDLKPDNIIVKDDGTLVLVDYDGMYVSAMKGQRARELGSPDFRHPNRTEDDFNEHIDDFSLASILLSLKTISLQPKFLEQYGASDRLLFSEKDYQNLSNSGVLGAMQHLMQDAELASLYSLFILALSQNNLSQVSFRLFNLKRPDKSQYEEENLSTEVTEDELANTWTDEFGVKYSLDRSQLIEFPTWNVNLTYSILPTCKYIEELAFPLDLSVDEDGVDYIWNDLISLFIPEGVLEIGDEAFIGCAHITNLVIPTSVKSIGVLSVGEDIKFPNCFVWIKGHPFIKEISDNIILVVEKEYYEDYKKEFPNDRVVINPHNYPLSETVCIDKIYYDKDLKWVIGCDGNCCNDIVIEQDIIGIAPYAFHNCQDISSINLPNSLLYIGEYAFCHSSLKEVEIPEDVIYIGTAAFEYCKNLLYARLPEGLQEISNVCFSGCSNLYNIKIPRQCVRIGSGAFSGCSIEELEITDLVRIIGEGAFRWCRNLYLLDFGLSRPLISNKSFVDCDSLRYILLPFYDCVIEEHAFGEMPNIKLFFRDGSYDYYLPKNIQQIVETWVKLIGTKQSQIGRFVYKIREKADISTEVSPVDLYRSYEDEFGVKYSSDMKRLLYASKPLNSYVIPEGTEIISSFAFENNSLCRIEFPKSLVRIGDYAFESCTQLIEINITSGIHYLGESVFSGCSSLVALNINCNIEDLPDGTFYGCSSLKRIDLLSTNLKRIGSHSFSWCEELETVLLPDGLEVIEHHSFAYCYKLAEIKIPYNTKKVGSEAFKDCINLSKIWIYNKATIFESLIFGGCTSLFKIYIPQNSFSKFEKMWPKSREILMEEVVVEGHKGISRVFTKEELGLVYKSKVVRGKFTKTVCLYMNNGGQSYIPLSKDSSLSIGDDVDLTKAKLIVLSGEGIYYGNDGAYGDYYSILIVEA